MKEFYQCKLTRVIFKIQISKPIDSWSKQTKGVVLPYLIYLKHNSIAQEML